MKNLLLFFLLFFSLAALAGDEAYNVKGMNQNGKSLEGTVYSREGQSALNGQLTDENGDTQSFHGQWDGDGQMSGETDDGDTVQLQVQSK